MIYVVIGLGEFGRSAALELQNLGNKVIGVDSDAKEAELISESLEHVVIADATDIHTLESINAAQCDGVLVSIGDDIEASLLCVVNLQSLGVANIWVKAKNDAHHSILNSLNIKQIIHPECEMGLRIAQRMNYPNIHDFMVIGNHNFIVKFVASAQIYGKCVADIFGKQTKVKLLMLMREGLPLLDFNAETLLLADDRLVCLGQLDALKSFDKLLKGN